MLLQRAVTYLRDPWNDPQCRSKRGGDGNEQESEDNEDDDDDDDEDEDDEDDDESDESDDDANPAGTQPVVFTADLAVTYEWKLDDNAEAIANVSVARYACLFLHC